MRPTPIVADGGVPSNDDPIFINPTTGEIEITYSPAIGADMFNKLTLLPNATVGVMTDNAVLPDGVDPFTPPTSSIQWLCLSASSFPNIVDSGFVAAQATAAEANVPARFLPSECR